MSLEPFKNLAKHQSDKAKLMESGKDFVDYYEEV